MPRLLIVEDERLISLMFQEALQEAGFEVETAHDGEEGLRRFRAGSYDLVISDVVMPIRDGLAMIAELRRLGAGVKILVITSTSEIGERYSELVEKLRPIPVLQKPITGDILVDAVRRLVGD